MIEGPTLISDARRSGVVFECQFVAPGSEPIEGAGVVHRLADGVLERVVETESSQGLVAIAKWRAATVAALDAAAFVVVADRVSDPGNLGTIVRSAEAAGADAVVVTRGSVDVTSPKVVRASAGAVFFVPIVDEVDIATLRDAGLRVLGTSSHRGVDYSTIDVSGRLAVVVGNESHGVPDDAPVDEWITIPHAGRAESLNVAMACTVACFEVARRRRSDSGTVTG